ncbi:MAG: AMP-binding protein [Sporichthyaceae bacterium]
MTERELKPVVVGPDGVPGLEAALDGTGPALLPLPAGPEGERLADALLPLAAGGVPATTAVVVPTSGSTGAPRGVRISAAALEQSAALTHRALGGPGQWLLAMSAARIAGLTVLVRSRAAGRAPAILPPGRFDPDAFAAAAARMDLDVPRYVSLVPTQLLRLLRAGVALDAFAGILLGGGPIPEGLPERASRIGARVIRTYGMTETCGGCVYDGLPLPGVRLTIGSGGLVRITGPVLAQGYLGPVAPPTGPPHLATGFVGAWFNTSDLGRIDGGGVLHVLGRADDVILTGGVNVPAQAVEAVLAGQDSVAEAVVVGVDDPEWGQRVVAVLVAGETEPDPEALRTVVAKRLGAAHAPKEFRVLADLPRLPSGKVDRSAVRALLAG